MSRMIRLRISAWMAQLISGVIEQLPQPPSRHLALPPELLPQDDPVLRETWEQSLLAHLGNDYLLLSRALSRLRNGGIADLDEEQTGALLRTISSVRLWLQREHFSRIPADLLQSDSVNTDTLPEKSQPAYACYCLLADIQEQIVEHLLQNDHNGDTDSTPPAEIDFPGPDDETDIYKNTGYDTDPGADNNTGDNTGDNSEDDGDPGDNNGSNNRRRQ